MNLLTFTFISVLSVLWFICVLQITVYAAYLFDAVILYAKAAHQLLLEGGEITNGTAIIHSLLNQSYESMLNFNKY